VYWGKN